MSFIKAKDLDKINHYRYLVFPWSHISEFSIYEKLTNVNWEFYVLNEEEFKNKLKLEFAGVVWKTPNYFDEINKKITSKFLKGLNSDGIIKVISEIEDYKIIYRNRI